MTHRLIDDKNACVNINVFTIVQLCFTGDMNKKNNVISISVFLMY